MTERESQIRQAHEVYRLETYTLDGELHAKDGFMAVEYLLAEVDRLRAALGGSVRLIEQWRGSAACCINRAEADRPWGDEDRSNAAVYARCADELEAALSATEPGPRETGGVG